MVVNSGAIKPLGVSHLGDESVLVGTLGFSGKLKLRLAKGRPGAPFRLDQHEPVIVLPMGKTEDPADIASINLSEVAGTTIMAYEKQVDDRSFLRIAVRTEDDGIETWEVASVNDHLHGRGVIVSEYKHGGQYALIHGTRDLELSFSKNLVAWSKSVPIIRSRAHYFDHSPLRIISATYVEQGILVLYQVTATHRRGQQLQVGGALLAKDNPSHIIWRSEAPIWESTRFAKTKAHQLVGAAVTDDDIYLYQLSSKNVLTTICFANPFAMNPHVRPDFALDRHPANPILSPRENDWEAVGVFNPAVFQHDGKIHILYRALSYSGMSYLGYAQTTDGYTIDYRSETPAYWPREPWEGVNTTPQSYSDTFASGGGWGGCEDPKLTLLEDTVYLTYVAHDGYGPPRVALSTIALEDFLAHNWDAWAKPRLISEPGVVNKSGVILPEKINGKYLVFHRVFPNILLHYDDNLEFEGDKWLETHAEIPIRPNAWDSRKLSVGATPMRIDDGWLVIYHAVDDRDPQKYKIGAMILDADDPSKVLYRTNSPILAPEEYYENEWKFGIAYPSGAAIKDGKLLVYYGGGDKFVCVAESPLESFVDKLKQEKSMKLTTKRSKVKE